MISKAVIEKFQMSFSLTPPAYTGLAAKIPFLEKLKIENIQHPKILQGVYTPNNDYLYLGQNIPLEESPNFLILVTPGQLNITMASPFGYSLNQMPVFKTLLWFIPKVNTYPINGIYIEGRTANVAMPMPQGTQIEYFCIFGQADIS